MKQCVICAHEVSRATAKTCSKDCQKEAARRRARAWYEQHRDDPALKVRVAEAARRHYEQVKADPNAWVERLTKTADWREANADRIREQEQAWRRTNAEKVRAKNQRRRARLLDAWVEDVDLATLWERDGGVCQICLSPIDPNLAWPHRESKTLDHIVPLSKGGTHEWANTQLAHNVCNARKNDRVSNPAL